MKDFLKKSALIVCASLLLFACKDEGGNETIVTLNKPTIDLKVGETFELKAAVTPEAEAANLVWASDKVSVATVDKNGVVTAIAAGEAIITARAGEASANCKVTVSAIPVTYITLDKESVTIPIGGTETLVATIEPEDATDKTVIWESSNTAIATVENGVVTAIAAGDVHILASAGEFSAICTVSVFGAPKVGDYYYEDGTWSDGGLISIEAHGLNPVWAAEKPAPKAGKTVIGIVFQTDQTRINAEDKAKGYTHGYVMSVKGAHGPDKLTTWWSSDYNFEALSPVRNSNAWYLNVNGYVETKTIKEKYGTKINLMPAFDWTINGYPLKAPATSSGWFVPSTGQAWDMAANLCGHEVAVVMKDWEQKKLNVGYGDCSETVSYDVMAKFNESMSKIPADQKEELFVTSSAFYSLCSIWVASPYSIGETAGVLNLGTKGLIELYEEYIDYDGVARPILAF